MNRASISIKKISFLSGSQSLCGKSSVQTALNFGFRVKVVWKPGLPLNRAGWTGAARPRKGTAANSRYCAYDSIGNRRESRTGTATPSGGSLTSCYATGDGATRPGQIVKKAEHWLTLQVAEGPRP